MIVKSLKSKEKLDKLFLDFIKTNIKNFDENHLDWKEACLFRTRTGVEYILLEYYYGGSEQAQSIYQDELIEEFKKPQFFIDKKHKEETND